ncbi:MAG: hypothetical protein JWO74_128 [Solirubrobacterales bacterium]|jgi:uncharacterized protein YkwD|nr:hypothetical protein [Solirubrobacterales bacterium]
MLARRASLFAAAVLTAALAIPVAAQAQPCAGADVIPTPATAGLAHSATLCLLNNERMARGLPELRSQPTLRSIATRYAGLMVTQGFFDHVSPGGSTLGTRIASSGYTRHSISWSAGENIGWGSGVEATPANMVAAWMASPPHRANILDRHFREIGIGVVAGAPAKLGPGEQAATYATEFGGRVRV